MNIRTKPPSIFTSREFNQHIARAKRAAKDGPVFITSRGEPTHVLVTKEEFDRLEAHKNDPPEKFVSLADALAQEEGGDFDYDFPEFKDSWSLKIPDLEN